MRVSCFKTLSSHSRNPVAQARKDRRKKYRVRLQVKELVDGNSKMAGQFLHFIQADVFFGPDPSVSAVVAYVQQPGYFIHKGNMIGQDRLNVLKKLKL